MERYEAYLQKYSVTDTFLGTPPFMDIGPNDKDLDDYEFSKPQFYIRKVGVTDPRDDILVGPTFKDIPLEDRAAPTMAPATAAAKKPEEKESDHESNGGDSDEEVEEPPKKKRGKKKPARKSVTVERSSKRKKAQVSYGNMGG